MDPVQIFRESTCNLLILDVATQKDLSCKNWRMEKFQAAQFAIVKGCGCDRIARDMNRSHVIRFA